MKDPALGSFVQCGLFLPLRAEEDRLDPDSEDRGSEDPDSADPHRNMCRTAHVRRINFTHIYRMKNINFVR